ncbi:MAG TPA: hypothetical protein VIU64_23595 [Polyangia bacterium]
MSLAAALLGGVIATGAWLRARQTEAPRADEERPPPDPPPALAAAPPPDRSNRTPRTGTAPAPAPARDEELLAGIRAHVRNDPRQAESLARQARARFPDSPHADEWDALLVDALVNQQRIGAARSETYYYYDHHPGGAFAPHLFALTGVHPGPMGTGPR